jgi:HAMP domain-containing protein
VLKDVEAFDELSVTDEDFTAVMNAEENDLVDAYVQGELSDGARQQFESHYLSSPRRKEKLQFAQTLQAWAENSAVVKDPVETATAPPLKSRGFRFRPLILRWGVATVAVVLLIASVWLAVQNSRLRRQLQSVSASQTSEREEELKKELEAQRAATSRAEEKLAQLRNEHELPNHNAGIDRPSQATSIASFILAPQLRGAAEIKTVKIPGGTQRVSMHLQLDPNRYSIYRAVLLEETTHKALWRSSDLKASGQTESKVVIVSFPAALLKPQTYTLQVSGVDSNGRSETINDYPFKVINQ